MILDGDGRPAKRFTEDPFTAIEAFLAEHGCTLGPQSGPPEPRVIGFLGYDLARVVEQLPGGSDLGRDTPDVWLGVYDALVRWQGDRADIVGPGAAKLATRITGDLQGVRVYEPFGSGGIEIGALHRRTLTRGMP